MSDAVQAATPVKKAKKVSKPKAPAAHPKYLEMTVAAIKALKERGGSSRQAIVKYIMANYKVGNDVKPVNVHLKGALKRGVVSGKLKQAKGTGASGSFRVGEETKEKKKPKAKKPKAVKKTKKPKAEKKPKAKKAKKPKAKSPKKAKVAKPKKAAAAKPKATTPKKAKSPKKAKKGKKAAPKKK